MNMHIQSWWWRSYRDSVAWAWHKHSLITARPEVQTWLHPEASKNDGTALFKIHNVINVSCIHLYHPPVAGQSIIFPEPVTVEGTPEYKVEEIMDSRLKCDKLEFLVKWSGYTNDYNIWEPEANCANSRDIIEEFYKSNPSTPWKLHAQDFARLVFHPYDNLTELKNSAVSRLEVET